MTMTKIASALALIAALAFAAPGCGDKKDDGAKKGGDDKAAAGDTKGSAAKPAMSGAKAKIAAKKIFKTRCATCHGDSGKGDGAAAQALDPKPRDYTDKAWQTSVTDEDLKKVIVSGGAAVGKAPTMTANPDLGKPEKAAVLAEIIKLIRAFGE